MGSDLYERAHFRIEGDRCLLIEYGEVIDPAVSQKVRFMAIVVKNNKPDGVIDIIPTCLTGSGLSPFQSRRIAKCRKRRAIDEGLQSTHTGGVYNRTGFGTLRLPADGDTCFRLTNDTCQSGRCAGYPSGDIRVSGVSGHKWRYRCAPGHGKSLDLCRRPYGRIQRTPL